MVLLSQYHDYSHLPLNHLSLWSYLQPILQVTGRQNLVRLKLLKVIEIYFLLIDDVGEIADFMIVIS